MLTPQRIERLVGRQDPVILDIGANDGENTEMFLRLFPQARIYSFEPDLRACARFCARISKLHTDLRAELIRTAVGAVDGSASFYESIGWPGESEKDRMPEGWDLSGSIKRPTGHLEQHPWCEFRQAIQVPITRLDTWATRRRVENVDFIWADVQGAEGDLILGGADTLMRTRYFYVEYSDRELYEGQPTLAKLCGFLPDFEIIERFENDVLFRNKELS